MATTTTLPKQIGERWISQKETVLAITIQTLDDGTPNPNYTKLATEVAEAKAERKRWDAFAGWVEKSLGMRLNAYPVRRPTYYDAGQVFLRKDKATGQITILTRQQAWEKYLEAQA